MADQALIPELARWAAAVRDGSLPDLVAADARRRVLDTVGIMLAALPLPTSSAALGWISARQGAARATVPGLAHRTTVGDAAFAGGVLAGSLEFDDTHLPSIVHPSASVVPACLAAAESSATDGSTLLAGVAVGIEIAVRIGMAGYDPGTRTNLWLERGQHATSICGMVGAAAAAALVMGLPADSIANAMGGAASNASGILEANRTGGTMKRTHYGWAAMGGVIAAELAAAGFTSPPTALEGRYGMFTALLGDAARTAPVLDELGERWLVHDVVVKPYPTNAFAHGGIDAALRLRAAGLEPNDVVAAVLRVPAPAVRTLGEPIERKRRPINAFEAQRSGPYLLAAALAGGSGLGVGLDDFTDDALRDPRRLDLASRVSVEAASEFDTYFPERLPAEVWVVTAGQRELTERVLDPRGGPAVPLSVDEVTAKYTDNVRSALGPEQSVRLQRAVEGLGVATGPGDVAAAIAASRRDDRSIRS
jgi:2-methylcitrate dehydratase PrpD